MIAPIIVVLILAYLTWSLFAMEINYKRASSMRIPLVRLPVDPMGIFWLIVEPTIWRILDHLPIN